MLWESCFPALSPCRGRCAERAEGSKLWWSCSHGTDCPSQPRNTLSVKKWSHNTAVFSLSLIKILWKDPGASICPQGEVSEEQRGGPCSLAVQGDLVPAAGISLTSLSCANPYLSVHRGSGQMGTGTGQRLVLPPSRAFASAEKSDPKLGRAVLPEHPSSSGRG